MAKNLPANLGDVDSILGQEDPLEKEIATHSSIAWEIPWTEEPAGCCPWGHKTVRHDLEAKQQQMTITKH